MDPEIEHSTRESMYRRSAVDQALANITFWLSLFNAGKCAGNRVLLALNNNADHLEKLGWHGYAIPF